MTSFTDWSLADVHLNGKGNKTCNLNSGGNPIYRSTGDFVTPPFAPSTFDKDVTATRQNLDLPIPPAMESYFEEIDDWMREYLEKNSERIFKRVLSAAQIRDAYHSILKKHGDYPPLLRLKIDSVGRRACRFWDTDKQKREAPEDWRSVELKARFHISHLWLMGTSCGLVMNLTDLQVREGSCAFPFSEDESPDW
jgi:hypothetical protein